MQIPQMLIHMMLTLLLVFHLLMTNTQYHFLTMTNWTLMILWKELFFFPYSNTNKFPSVLSLDAGDSVAFRIHLSYVW